MVNYLKTYNNYLNLLSDFLKFKSISTDPAHKDEIGKTADWLSDLFKKNGLKTKIWKDKDCNPVVFAEYMLSTDHSIQPTVLIYGHYDVQPATKADGWKRDPFELYDDGERLYGRGVIDNKGQVLVHIVTILNLIKEGNLKYNIKFMIEGNEETGNTALSKIMIKHKKELKCGFVLISDGELTNNKPTIEISLRGGFNAKLTYRTGKNNLHSGMWGGAVPNAAYELSKFLSKLYDSNNSVSFNGFYQGLDKITPKQLENNKLLEKESVSLSNLAGVKEMKLEKGYDFFTATGLRPTVQISGFKSGYIESGFSNIVPAEAEVRLNFRTASSQKSETVVKAFSSFVKKQTPKYVEYKLEINNPHEPVKISENNKYLNIVIGLLEKIYGQKVNRRNAGGAIPFVADVKTILGVETVSVPLVNEDCNMHGANENFDNKHLLKALEFSHKLFSN